MYTVNDIVEIGKAQSLILQLGKTVDENIDDVSPFSTREGPDFDE